MAVSPTDRNESLQCVACALRQSEGQDITERDLVNAILDWDGGTLESSVINAIGITGEMEHEIKNWTKKWNTLERVNIQQKKREYDNWIKSSVLVANKLAGSRYIDKSGYTFFRQDSFPEYKDRAYSFAQDIKKNTNNSVMKAVYNASVGSGWKDKWNPSDILAVKSATQVRNQLRNFDAVKVNNESKKLRQKNKDNRKLKLDGKAIKQLVVMEEMDNLYEYNKLIDDLCDSKECVGISLKQQLDTLAVPIKKYDHKDIQGLKDAMMMEVEIGEIEWKPTASKAIINFSVGDGQVFDDNWFLDVRGTESGKTKLGGVQINLMYTGGTTAHGKASISVFSLITRLSGGLKALKAQHRKKKELFGKREIGKAKGTLLTDHMVFDDYATGKNTDFDNWRMDLPLWIQYIDFLTESKVRGREVLRQFSGVKETRGRTATIPAKLRQALKYLKNKVQAYEVAYVFDKDNGVIREAVRENIMKGVYSYAGSMGFRIFTDQQVTDFMTSSTYIKVGGL
tara:strand:- start:49 stop:1581 length:1533 start_codon:yes stop_codon:yes gene_type:complete